MEDQPRPQRDYALPTGVFKFLGTFFTIIGALNLTMSVIALIVLLVKGGDAEGWVLVIASVGSGTAFLFIGYAMRRLAGH